MCSNSLSVSDIHDFKLICRLCGESSDALTNLHVEEEREKFFKECIKKYIGIPIHMNDGFPAQICNVCSCKLDDTANFIQKCLRMHEVFQKAIEDSIAESEIVLPTKTDSFEDSMCVLENVTSILEDSDPIKTECEGNYFFPESSIKESPKMEAEESDDAPLIKKESLIVEQNGVHECKQCKRVYASKYTLKTHQKRVHDYKMEKGPKCERVMKTSYLLSTHSHNNEKQFLCETCSKCFSNPMKLRVHQETHLPREIRQKYYCEVYNKSNENKQERRKKRQWCKQRILNREQQGYFNNLIKEFSLSDAEGYRSLLRMNQETFEALSKMIAPYIQKRDTNYRKAIPAREKLAITLRYLATGESHMSLAFQFRVGQTTITKFIREVCDALSKCLQNYLKTPSTQEEWKETEKTFFNLWNFPLCIGAIDGRHVLVTPPPKSGGHSYNYKGVLSVILLAVVDANLNFIYVNVGSNGRMSDGGVWDKCSLNEALKEEKLNLPPACTLPGTNFKSPRVFVADDAFPLKTFLMKPYPGRGTDTEKNIFNYRLSRARRCVENAFGILASRFQVLRAPIRSNPESVKSIVMAACHLHNYLRKSSSSQIYCPPDLEDKEDIASGTIRRGDWRNEGNNILHKAVMQGGNNYPQEARNVRDNFCIYFNTIGQVPWQNEMALKH